MQIQILVYDGFDELDALAPFEVFGVAASAGADLQVELVRLEHASVGSARGVRLHAERQLDPAHPPELLLVPGGGWNARAARGAWAEVQRGRIPAMLAEMHAAGTTMAAVCTGAMLLAAAGLVRGRPAVTHHRALEELRAAGAEVVRARVVDDGDLLTSGVSPPDWIWPCGWWSATRTAPPPTPQSRSWSMSGAASSGAAPASRNSFLMWIEYSMVDPPKRAGSLFVSGSTAMNTRNRSMRTAVSLITTGLLLAGCAHTAPRQVPDTLKEAYEDAFLMGVAVGGGVVSGADTASRDIVIRQFNTITAENVLKAGPINPRPGVYNFEPADAFVEFGERHGMFIVGHTLVWHNQTPAWFFLDEAGNPNTPEAQVERLRSHIQVVAGRYAGRIHAWDVVNEVIDNDGSYRPTTWVKGVGSGDELVKHAFRFASQYAPGAELYYNDFNAWRPAKRDGIMRLVRMLQAEGIRIDGVGMQGHWGLNYPRTEYIEAAIDSFASLGVKVMITELDVDVLPLTREGQVIGSVMSDPQFQLEEFEEYLDPYPAGLPDAVQGELADRYAELFRIFYRKRDKIDRVTLWGVHDGMSWKNNYPVPGRTNYPLLWDRDRRPKPALDAVLDVPRQMR